MGGFPVRDLLDNISLLIYLYIMNGKQVIKKLQAEGWILERVNGSHHILRKGNVSVTVPVHGTKDLKKGTFSSIMKETGVRLK